MQARERRTGGWSRQDEQRGSKVRECVQGVSVRNCGPHERNQWKLSPRQVRREEGGRGSVRQRNKGRSGQRRALGQCFVCRVV